MWTLLIKTKKKKKERKKTVFDYWFVDSKPVTKGSVKEWDKHSHPGQREPDHCPGVSTQKTNSLGNSFSNSKPRFPVLEVGSDNPELI